MRGFASTAGNAERRKKDEKNGEICEIERELYGKAHHVRLCTGGVKAQKCSVLMQVWLQTRKKKKGMWKGGTHDIRKDAISSQQKKWELREQNTEFRKGKLWHFYRHSFTFQPVKVEDVLLSHEHSVSPQQLVRSGATLSLQTTPLREMSACNAEHCGERRT